MRAIKTTTMSILAVGLLAGSSAGTAAQEEDTGLEAAAAFRLDLADTVAWGDAQKNTGLEGKARATDPRASGDWVSSGQVEWLGDFPGAPPWYVVSDQGVRIENEDGAWAGTAVAYYYEQPDTRTKKQKRRNRPKVPPRWRYDDLITLTGEGDYTGLTMYLSAVNAADLLSAGTRYVGIIVPTEVVPRRAGLALDTSERTCVRVSDPVEADRLNEAVAAGEATIAVVPDAECSPGAALDALSDAEHFGAFMGHVVEVVPELGSVPDHVEAGVRAIERDLRDQGVEDFDELLADPRASEMAAGVFDRAGAWFDAERAWLEQHPPRPCYASIHEDWLGFVDAFTPRFEDFATAFRAGDAEWFSGDPGDERSSLAAMDTPDLTAHTCWTLTAA